MPAARAAVLGFPCPTTLFQFIDASHLFKRVKRELTDRFQRKTCSLGAFTVPSPSQPTSNNAIVFEHRCPTLRGTSGGPFLVLHSQFHGEGKETRFAGIHIGVDPIALQQYTASRGSQSTMPMPNNYAISVRDPAFVRAYLRAIAQDVNFSQKHRVFLANLTNSLNT